MSEPVFAARVRWDSHSDLLRTQLQETGRIRLSFLRLSDLLYVVTDLGINLEDIAFREGYAVVGRDENSHSPAAGDS